MISILSTNNSTDLGAALKDAQSKFEVAPNEVEIIQMKAGDHYLLTQDSSGNNELIKEVVALRKGDDLIIFHASGSKVILADYYLFSASADDANPSSEDTCSVTVAGAGDTPHTFTTPELAAEKDGVIDTSSIVYVQTNPDSLETIVSLDKAALAGEADAQYTFTVEDATDNGADSAASTIVYVQASPESLASIANANNAVVAGQADTQYTFTVQESTAALSDASTLQASAEGDDAGFSLSTGTILGAIGAVGLIGVAASSSSSSTPAAAAVKDEPEPIVKKDEPEPIVKNDDDESVPEPAAIAKTYSVVVSLGPQLVGDTGTTITLYKADGSVLGVMVAVGQSFTYIDNTGYSGVVIARLRDTDDTPDYFDEATEAEADITADLFVVASVTATETTVSLSITPLSTVAAKELGVVVTDDAISVNATVATVDSVNKAVAKAFGLGDNLDIARAEVKTTIDLNGESASDANDYGIALALISAEEEKNTEDTNTVIDKIVAGLDSDEGTLSNVLINSFVDSSSELAGIDRDVATRFFIGDDISKTYNVVISLGPQLEDDELTTVTFYKADGTKLLGEVAYTAGQGYTYTDTTGYSGIVIARLHDGDTAPDYLDEATGQMTDITADLFVVASVTATETTVSLSITPLSTVAAKELGDGIVFTTDTNGNLVDIIVNAPVAEVNRVNKAVAKAFGLGDNVDIARAEVITTIDNDGKSASDANPYGLALALISANVDTDEDFGTATTTVIDNIVAGLDSTGEGTLSAELKISLIESASEAGIGDGEATRLLNSDSTNAKPTGGVTIAGNAQAFSSLTATHTLADTDNATDRDVIYTYQWQANSIDIEGAESPEYELTQNEVGKTITVQVSYIDGDGAAGLVEIVESAATNVVAPTVKITLDNTDTDTNSDIPFHLKEGETITFTLTFSEAPIGGLAISDIIAPNGRITSLAVDLTNPKSYTVTFTPTEDTTDHSNIISILGTSWTGASGITPVNGASANYVVATAGPSLIAAPLAIALSTGGGDSVNETITLTITFDRDVAGLLTGTDNTVFAVGGVAVEATWSGTTTTQILTYTVGDENGQVTVNEAALKTLLVAVNGITDATNTSIPFVYTDDIPDFADADLPIVDTTVPTLSSTLPYTTLVEGGNSIGDTITLTITFSEDVNGLMSLPATPPVALVDNTVFLVNGAVVNATWSGTGNTRVLTYKVASETGLVTINEAALKKVLGGITDAAGNAFVYVDSAAAELDIVITSATPLPTVDITVPALADTTPLVTGGTGDGTLADHTVTLTITFNDSVVGLASGISNNVFKLNGNNVDATWSVGLGNSRLLTYTVVSGQDGDVTIDAVTLKAALAAGIKDAAGNSFVVVDDDFTYTDRDDAPISNISNETLLTTNTTPPTLSSTSPPTIAVETGGGNSIGDTITLTITFSEPVIWTDLAAGNTNSDVFKLTDSLGAVSPTASEPIWSVSDNKLVWTLTYMVTKGDSGQVIIVQDALNSLLTGADIEDDEGEEFDYTADSIVVDNIAALPTVNTDAPTLSSTSPTIGLVGDGTPDVIGIGKEIVLTITFTEPVSGLTGGIETNVFKITIDGNTNSVDATWFGNEGALTRQLTYTVASGENGQVTIDSVALKAALADITDAEGNEFVYTVATGTSDVINDIVTTALPTVDGTAPTVTVALDGDGAFNIIGEKTALVTFTFSEQPSRDFDVDDISAPNGTITGLEEITPTTFRATFTATSDTTEAVTITVGQNWTDIAGNSPTSDAHSASYTVDTIAPTLISSTISPTTAVAVTGGGNSIGDTITLTITFDGAVNGLTDGTVSNVFIVGDTNVEATWSGTDDTRTRTLTYTVKSNGDSSGPNGLVTINKTTLKTALAEDGGITDAAGNAFVYTTTTVTNGEDVTTEKAIADIDTTALLPVNATVPTVTVVLTDSEDDTPIIFLKMNQTATVTFDFNEVPIDFDWDDITSPNGTITNLVVDASDATIYTATFTPTADYSDDVDDSITVGNGWIGTSGNSPTGLPALANGANGASANYTVDTVAPTLSNASPIIGLDDGDGDSIGDTITLTITFNGNVTGLTSGTSGGVFLLPNPNDPNATMDPIDPPTWSVGVDSSDNPVNSIRVLTYTVANGDTGQVTIDQDALMLLLTHEDNGIKDAAGNGLVYTLDGVNPSPINIITTVLPIVDGTAPTLGDTSPAVTTITSDGGDSIGNKITLTIIFSEDVMGFIVDNSTVFNVGEGENSGVLASWESTIDADTWKLIYTVTEDQNGEVTIDEAALKTLLETTITDTKGNAFVYGSDIIITPPPTGLPTVDGTRPTVTVEIDDTALKVGDTPTVTFTFSEAPAGFIIGNIDISAANGSILAESLVETSGSDGKIWTATFIPLTTNNNGTTGNTITLHNTWTDVNGNAPATSGIGVSQTYSVDTDAPKLSLDTAKVPIVESTGDSIGQIITLTITFEDTVYGLLVGINNGVFKVDGTAVDATWSSISDTERVLTYRVVSGQNGEVTIDHAVLEAALVADITDIAGNIFADTVGMIEPPSELADVDTSAPTITNTTLDWGPSVNEDETVADDASDVNAQVTVLTTGAVGQTVYLVINRISYQDVVGSDGTATINVPRADLLALADGSTQSYTVNVSDAAGNPAPTDTGSFTVDKTVPVITNTTLSWGPSLNALEDNTIGVVTVTIDNIEDGQIVSLMFADDTTTYTGVVSGNVATIIVTASGLENLSDRLSQEYTVRVLDAADNSVEYTTNFIVDTTPPVITSTMLDWGSSVNKDETVADDADDANAQVTVRTTGVEVGQTVYLVINGTSYEGNVVSGGITTINVPRTDLLLLADGSTQSYTVNVSDAADNPAPQGTGIFTVDKTLPTIASTTLSWGDSLNTAEAADTNGGTVTVVTTGVEDGQIVTLTIEDLMATSTLILPLTGEVTNGIATISLSMEVLAALTNSQDYTVTVSDAADNIATKVRGIDGTFIIDTSRPTIGTVTVNGGNIVNAEDANTDGITVTVATTGAIGQIVSLVINGETYTGVVVVSNGQPGQPDQATITVPASGVQALADGTHEYTVTVSNAAGNPAAAVDPLTSIFTVETSAPTITSTTLDWGPSVNEDETVADDASDTNAQVTVRTTGVEVGQTVYLVINRTSYEGNVVSGDITTINVPRTDLLALADGSTQSYTVNVLDAAGNPAPTDTGSFTVDKTVPVITSVTPSWGTSLNALEANTIGVVTVAISSIENGQIVSLSITSDRSGTDTITAYTGVVNNNVATIIITAAGLQALAEGNNAYTVSVSDAAGNSATSVTDVFIVNTSAPTITSTTLGWGNSLNDLEDDANGTVTVVTDGAQTGQTVSLVINGKLYTGVVGAGIGGEEGVANTTKITVLAVDLQNLADGSIQSYTVNVSNDAGNPATQGTGVFTVDKTYPIIDSVTPSWGTILNSLEDDTDGTVTVETTGVEDGQVVTFVISFNNGTSITDTEVVTNNTTTIIVAAGDLGNLGDGSYTYTVNVSDAAGNRATKVDGIDGTFTIDTTRPTIESTTLDWTVVVDGTDVLNALGDDTAGTVTVATTGAANQTVSLVINGVTYTGEVDAVSNQATITVPASGLQALAEGIHDYTVNVSNAAGNPADPVTREFMVDTTGPMFSAYPTVGSVSDATSVSIILTVTFDDTVSFRGIIDGTTDFRDVLIVGGERVLARWSNPGVDNTWLLTYPVTRGVGPDGPVTIDEVALKTALVASFEDVAGNPFAHIGYIYPIDTSGVSVADTTAPMVVNTIPIITSADLDGPDGDGGTARPNYYIGDTFTLTIEFNENMKGLLDGDISGVFQVGGEDVTATWLGVDGTNTRTLTYTVTDNDEDAGSDAAVTINVSALKVALTGSLTDTAATPNPFDVTGIESLFNDIVPPTPTVDTTAVTGFDDASNDIYINTVAFNTANGMDGLDKLFIKVGGNITLDGADAGTIQNLTSIERLNLVNGAENIITLNELFITEYMGSDTGEGPIDFRLILDNMDRLTFSSTVDTGEWTRDNARSGLDASTLEYYTYDNDLGDEDNNLFTVIINGGEVL